MDNHIQRVSLGHIPANKNMAHNVLLLFPWSYKNIVCECFPSRFYFFWVLMFPNSWEHTNRCLIKSTNYMLIRSDIKGLATSWAWERISTSLHRPTLTRTHNPCPHCLWSFPPCDMTLPCVSWFTEPLPSPNPPFWPFPHVDQWNVLGRPELCSWVWAASTILNPSHNNGVKGSLPKPCLSAWHPTALLGSLHLEPKPHREASSLVTRATPAPHPQVPINVHKSQSYMW